MTATPAPAWRRSVPLRFRDFDYLGHMTASSYLALLEENRVEWLAGTDPDGRPGYVVATQELTFHREILPADGPVAITVTGRPVSARSYEVHETIAGATGHLHATSRARLVGWDRERRAPRPLTQVELALLEGRAEIRTGV
ncbi:thioesterase family protein [Nocardioides sp. L-11A]|uniref:acyl-CoA thioesterase n=1 Tax=Nocardioides sp. L-11A TaxID=3043848 RepID=UPI00249AC3F5|nr:thioesterase family protein [Nocardioides sp. L-11A]